MRAILLARVCGDSHSHGLHELPSEDIQVVSWSREKRLLGRGPWQSAEDACGGFPVAVEVTWVNGDGLHK